MEAIINELKKINERLTALEGPRPTSTQANRVHQGRENYQQPRWRWEGNSRVFSRSSHNNRTARPNQPPPQRNGPSIRPLLPNLDRPEVTDLTKTLYHSVQLRHHARNWDPIPINLDKEMDSFFEKITPPMPNSTTKAKIDSLREQTKGNLASIILDHISTARKELDEKLSATTLFGENFDKAAELARTRLLGHFRRKISMAEVNAWLTEDRIKAEGLSGTEEMARLEAESGTTDARSISLSAWTTVPTSGGRPSKRAAQSPTSGSPTPTSNRFQALQEGADGIDRGSDDEEFEEAFPPLNTHLRTPVSKKTRFVSPLNGVSVANFDITEQIDQLMNTTPAARPEPEATRRVAKVTTGERRTSPPVAIESPPSPTMSLPPLNSPLSPTTPPQPGREEVLQDLLNGEPTSLTAQSQPAPTTGGKVNIHPCSPKNAWAIEVGVETQILVISDSNMRLARNLPAQWEAHVFPGAYLSHAASLIDKLPRKNSLRAIVVMVGINNRGWKSQQDVRHDVLRIANVADKLRVPVHFTGISIPPELQPNETLTLKQLNLAAKEKFRHRYIGPLDTTEVSVNPSDKFKIHYDQATVDKILVNVTNHFLSKIPQMRRISM